MGGKYFILKKAYHWLSEPQLRSALSCYALYLAEIDARMDRNRDLDRKKKAERFSFLAKQTGAE